METRDDPPITPEVRWPPQGVGLFTFNEMMDFISSNIIAALPTRHDNPGLRTVMIDLKERAPFTFN